MNFATVSSRLQCRSLLRDKLLERCRTMGLLKARGQQRTDSTHVAVAIRVMNRLELVAETLRSSAQRAGDGGPRLAARDGALAWYERYGKRIEDTRRQASRDAYAQRVGEEGFALLDAPGGRRDACAPPGVTGDHHPAADLAAPL